MYLNTKYSLTIKYTSAYKKEATLTTDNGVVFSWIELLFYLIDESSTQYNFHFFSEPM
jgi:hypothetical protein